MKTIRSCALRMLLLALMAALLWCWQNNKLTWAAWSVPLDYTGDSLEILARIQAASEGDVKPFHAHFVTRLGAPFDASWNEYPGTDDITNYLLGVLARAVGVIRAANLALLLAQVTAALAFYACARLLRHRWEWAFAGGLLFSFSYFNLSRSMPHLWLTFTYTVPLALLTCWVIAMGRRTCASRGWRWLCYGTAFVLGISNPYNLFLYFQLLALAVLTQWLRSRWSPGVRLGLACGVIAAVMLGAVHAYMRLSVIDEGGTPLLVRNYAGTEIYSLKPIELFLPPSGHHGAWFAAAGSRYVRWSDWRGETFSPYLGVIGGVSLLAMLALFVRALVLRRRPWPAAALPALWIVGLSTVGGINSMLAFFVGLNLFRATNRFSVFLFALALFFMVAILSRLTRRWHPVARLGVAAAAVLFGLWDQMPRRRDPKIDAMIAEHVAADRRLGAALEKRLPRGGMVFQLPLLDFPEGAAQFRLNEYDHFRPYLVTRTIQFTYGESKNRARGAWQSDCRGLQPAELVKTLERYGFAAIYIDKRGFADEAASLLAGLAAAGRPERIEEPPATSVVVLLHPAEHPRQPLARHLTFGEGWNPRFPSAMEPGGTPRPPSFPPGMPGRQWPASSGAGPAQPRGPGMETRWTTGSAALSYFNPFPRPLTVGLKLVVSGIGDRTLILRLNGRALTRRALTEEEQEIDLPEVGLRPGVNRLDLETPEPAVRVSEQRWSLRAIGLHRLQLRVCQPDDMAEATVNELGGEAGQG